MKPTKEIEALKDINIADYPSVPTWVGESELYNMIKSMIVHYENYIFPRKVEIIKMKYLCQSVFICG